MIHKVYILFWVTLIVGVIFLVISIYTLFRGIKRDKIIAISIFLLCVLGYIFTELRIDSHNAKARIYFGTHELLNYNNSSGYTLEVLPNREYLIFDDEDTITHGTWELSVSDNNSTMLLLDGEVFGVGELDIK